MEVRLLFRGLARVHLIVGLPLHAAFVDLALPEIGPAFRARFAGMVTLCPRWLISHVFHSAAALTKRLVATCAIISGLRK